MTRMEGTLLLCVIGLLALIGWDKLNPPAPVTVAPDTVFLNLTKSGAAVAANTQTTLRRARLRVDSFYRDTGSTKFDTAFISTIDTVFQQCERCAAKLDTLARKCEDNHKANRDTIALLRSQLAREKGSRWKWVTGGVVGGSLACGLGGR